MNHQIHRKGSRILLGLSIEAAVMDILTDEERLRDCIQLLNETQSGLIEADLGSFGVFKGTLNVHHDNTVSLFIDGPEFDDDRFQSSAIWVNKAELRKVFEKAIGS